MEIKDIYTNHALYRDTFRLQGYYFGHGKPTVAIVGNTRGNEYQQIYMCALLVDALKNCEAKGLIHDDYQVLVIPSCNPYSMNIGKRFWPIDNTDINRMFPGYIEGETTQRIAGAIFEIVNQCPFGIQLASYYLPGSFIPNITIMDSPFIDDDYIEMAKHFNMPYIVLRNMRPYDTTTLNYNWQVWNTKAFSLYTTDTSVINHQSALRGVHGVLNFLSSLGIVDYNEPLFYQSIVIHDKNNVSIQNRKAGIFIPDIKVEDRVSKGQVLGTIINPIDASILETITSPLDGTVFFLHAGPMVYGHTPLIKIIPYS